MAFTKRVRSRDTNCQPATLPVSPEHKSFPPPKPVRSNKQPFNNALRKTNVKKPLSTLQSTSTFTCSVLFHPHNVPFSE